jgi:hypothetical protein
MKNKKMNELINKTMKITKYKEKWMIKIVRNLHNLIENVKLILKITLILFYHA